MAVQSGVETSLGSLWRVNDTGSLALMLGFYEQLKTAPTRSEALRQAQLAMLRGQIQLQGNRLRISPNLEVALPEGLGSPQTFQHPYFWSTFQMVGNWN
jgi:CHAT domain-containing protein